MKSSSDYLKQQSIVTLESVLSRGAIGFAVTQEGVGVRRLPNTHFSLFPPFFLLKLAPRPKSLCASETTALICPNERLPRHHALLKASISVYE